MSEIQWGNPKITVEQVQDHGNSVPAYNKADFVIENGVLVEYIGHGGDILIPPKVSKIGENAFAGCTALTGVVFSPTVKEIGDYAFYGCANLAKVKFSPQLEYIGDCAFYECGCLSIENLVSLKRLGKDVFNGVIFKNQNQEDFIIEDGTLKKYIGNNSIVCIPDTVKTIGNHAFNGSQSIVFVMIPNSVISIEYCAFSNCSNLGIVAMTSSVKEIGDYAFSRCVNLACINISSDTRRGKDVFALCGKKL